MSAACKGGYVITHSSIRSYAKWMPLVSVFAVCSTLGAAGYHLVKSIQVPGDYGWDYATAETEGRRL